MSDAQRISDELNELKDELGKLASENVTAAMAASREKIDEAAKLLGGVIAEVEEFVTREEENMESLIASRPVLSVAAAFLAGLALGVVLRRR